MLAKLDSLEQKFIELEKELSAPDIFQDQEKYKKVSKAHAELEEIVTTYREYKKLTQQLEESQELLKDPELKDLAEEEIKTLKKELTALEERLKILLVPKDPLDEKNIILEIRAGTGGEEAALFAADLFRMYSRYAEKKAGKWKSWIPMKLVLEVLRK